MDQFASYASLTNLQMLEDLYEKWIADPSSVDLSWKNFFEGMQFASHLPQALPARQESDDLRISTLIHAYRRFGHLYAHCDVLSVDPPPFPEELKYEQFGLSDADLSREFPTLKIFDKARAPLKEIIDVLQGTYCRNIGIEYMDLGSNQIEQWVQQRIEPYFPSGLNDDDRKRILNQLSKAEGFESFLHMKYVGQKRFSLEGEETFIPMLHEILRCGGSLGVTQVVLGMAHRGRLNVLASILGKSYEYIFKEFEDRYTPDLAESSGDVKYHMGFVGMYQGEGEKEIKITLSANPSHLESVDPVVEGGARALQEQLPKNQQQGVVPILVHGDAAISGQGVVYETMTLSRLKGYSTKGTIHIVINNQIGFTTYPKDGRSTRYCTDIAKAFGAPVLRVNGEDPEACVTAAKLAMELRQEFGCDVFIDLMGYRKYGHNESDEPTFTQPLQYQMIRAKKTMREIYRDRLIETGVLSQQDADQMEGDFKAGLDKILQSVKSQTPTHRSFKSGKEVESPLLQPFDTAISEENLGKLGQKISEIPSEVNVHPKIQRLLKERQNSLSQDISAPTIDWGTAELLAYASLATEGVHVRISGQDCRRGTFSHRHALFVDQVNADHYYPLSHLGDDQAPVDIFNSPLSEFAVMGFEFGYSLLYPKSLVLWEGQFGDFANGAQVIIDQYLSSSEVKWGHATNLTLLLPHGYEGMGPEHSSARMERFLQMCAEDNMLVCNPSTPAQLFHLLRRQGLWTHKKPLIVFTPKALLRLPACRSSREEFTSPQFQEILPDPNPPTDPKRIILCSGKIYYELVQEREKRGCDDLIIRIEQIYPLHGGKLREIFEQHPNLTECIWLQEEHENMGAWRFLEPQLLRILDGKLFLRYVGREAAASTAAGSHTLHKQQNEQLLQDLYGEGSTS